MNKKLREACIEQTNRLLTMNIAKLFSKPVDPIRDDLPEYFDIVRKPMDLGTIRRKLKSNEYRTVQAWKNDVDLIWQNCYAYNGKDSLASRIAEHLENMFKKNTIGLSDNQREAWITKFKILKANVDRLTAIGPFSGQAVQETPAPSSRFETPEPATEAVSESEDEQKNSASDEEMDQYERQMLEKQRRDEIRAREKERIQQKEREREQYRREQRKAKMREYEFEQRRRAVSQPRISEDDMMLLVDFINGMESVEDIEKVMQIIEKYEPKLSGGGDLEMDVTKFKNETLVALNNYVKSALRRM